MPLTKSVFLVQPVAYLADGIEHSSRLLHSYRDIVSASRQAKSDLSIPSSLQALRQPWWITGPANLIQYFLPLQPLLVHTLFNTPSAQILHKPNRVKLSLNRTTSLSETQYGEVCGHLASFSAIYTSLQLVHQGRHSYTPLFHFHHTTIGHLHLHTPQQHRDPYRSRVAIVSYSYTNYN